VDKIKVAVIGAGIMGDEHARCVAESFREELVAISDINIEKAKGLSEKYGGCTCYSNYNEMLDQCDIDAVCIATPDFLHTQPVMDCLNAGKHVLVEKPLATGLEDSKRIIETEEKSGRILMINYTHRWAAPYFRAKSEILSGRIGKPVMAYAKKDDTIYVPTKMISWAGHTSPAMFLSSHDIDLVMWFFDSGISEIFAYGKKGVLKGKGIDTYDAIQALVKFSNGAIGTFESAWIYPDTFPTATDSYIQLVGEKGVITLDRKEEMIAVATGDEYSYPKLSISSIIDGKLAGAFKLAHDHFIDCIISGSKPMISARTGYAVSEVTAAIHRSIESGKPVSLPLDVKV
jgi:predicted dehydrogenase